MIFWCFLPICMCSHTFSLIWHVSSNSLLLPCHWQGGCVIQIIVFPYFAWGKAASQLFMTILQATSRWTNRGRQIRSVLELTPGCCYLFDISFLNWFDSDECAWKLGLSDWIISLAEWLLCLLALVVAFFCHFLLLERNLLEWAINDWVVLHKALVILDVSLIFVLWKEKRGEKLLKALAKMLCIEIEINKLVF